MNEPHIWWYITRASALIAWVLMTLSVVWGILLSTRLLRKVDNPSWLQDLHQFLAGTSVVMVLLHMVSLMLDGWLHFSLVQVLVPFTTDYRALGVALGILAFYFLIAVQGTSLMMKRLPRKFWRAVHYTSYAALLLVSFHAGLSGTDVGAWWYRSLSIALIVLAAISILLRILLSKPTDAPPVQARPGPAEPELRTMVVAATSHTTDEVLAIRLVPLGGGPLPIWHAGAHITLHLPNGLQRQYSLCGDPADRGHFDIAVLRTVDSEGGSRWIHSELQPGMTLEVSGPLNHFELEPSSEYRFIAGGIGITPIKAMIESLPAHRNWRLDYVGRTRSAMVFADALAQRYPGRVHLHVNDEAGERMNLDALLTPSSALVYCCGPESLMEAIAERVPTERLHFERFIPIDRSAGLEAKPVTVTARRSGLTFDVPADESILDVMDKNGVPIIGSCRKGVCGTCEVRVLGGEPEHLDSVMSDAEKVALGIMYPCVSRAKTPTLVLDV